MVTAIHFIYYLWLFLHNREKWYDCDENGSNIYYKSIVKNVTVKKKKCLLTPASETKTVF